MYYINIAQIFGKYLTEPKVQLHLEILCFVDNLQDK